MTFLQPAFLWLLPLALSPLIWHRFFTRTREVSRLPSDFILRRLKKSLPSRLALSNWLEILLEILFIAALILFFAKPLPKTAGSGRGPVFIFIDNTPSLFARRSSIDVRRVISASFSEAMRSPSGRKVYLFDAQRVREGLQPVEIKTAGEAAAYFQRLSVMSSPWQYLMLEKYMQRNEGLFAGGAFSLVLAADLQSRHFLDPVRFQGMDLYQQELPSGDLDLCSSAVLPKRMLFAGEKIPLNVTLQHQGAKTRKTLTVESAGKVSYRGEIDFNENQTKEQTVFLVYDTPGWKAVKISLGGLSSRYLALWVSSRVRFALSGDAAACAMMREMFSEQISRGYMIADNSRPDVRLAMPLTENASWQGGGKLPAIIFFDAAAGAKALSRLLADTAGPSVTLASTRVRQSIWREDSSLSGGFEIFGGRGLFDSLTMKEAGDLNVLPPAQIWASYEDGRPWLIRSGRVWVLPFNPSPAKSDLLLRAAAVPFFDQLLLSVLRPGELADTSAESHDSQGSDQPLLADSDFSWTSAPGVYSNSSRIICANIAQAEWLQGNTEDVSSIMPGLKNIKNWIPSAENDAPFNWRPYLFLLLSFLSLCGLTALYFYKIRLKE